MLLNQTHTIVICNQKGGCGKTTSSVNAGAALAEAGYRVCLIDMDPQCNLTNNFKDKLDAVSIDGDTDAEYFTIFDVMVGNQKAEDSAITFPDHYDGNLSIIPGVKNLSSISRIFDNTIQATIASENHSDIDADDIRVEQRHVLKEAFKSLEGKFDFIIVDTPPDLDFLLTVSLIAADWTIIPVQPSEYDVEGIVALIDTIRKVRERYNPSLGFMGVLLCRYVHRINLDKGFLAMLSEEFGDELMLPPVGNYKDCREAPTDHVTVLEHAPKCDASEAYRKVAQSIVKKVLQFEGKVANRLHTVNSK